MPSYRSVSQYKDYVSCPQKYFLQRLERAWQRPAAWLPQGTAVHEAAEAWERSGRTMTLEAVQQVFAEAYAREVNKLCEDSPNFRVWFRSGPYDGEQDVERRFLLGLEQIRRYVEYYTEKHPEEVIWITPEGTPAIELKFEASFGGVDVRGYIDQVTTVTSGATPEPSRMEPPLVVRDIKSGNTPGDDFQLATYARALEQQYDVEISSGDYWMGRSGKPTIPYALDYWTAERLGEEYARVDDGIKGESFDPVPESSKCRFCSVASACDFAA